MDIPDEAIRAAAQARLGPSPRLEDLLKGHLAYELNMAEEQLEAAAPHIARAAQVQILREIAAEDEAEIARLNEQWASIPAYEDGKRRTAIAGRISATARSKAQIEHKLHELEQA